jgi:hypothetical protein
MNSIKYEVLIDEQIKNLTLPEKKEVFDFVEFLKLRRIKEDPFLAAIKEGQKIGKRLGVTEKDIEEEIKAVRKIKHG